MAEYCYVMKGMTKVLPGGKEVLSNVWLSFLPGAKIGVIGPNGAGKSTLLRIMAGEDTDIEGEPGPPPATRSATCPRNRSSTSPWTCAGTSWRAWASCRGWSSSTRAPWRWPSPWTTTRCSASRTRADGPGQHRRRRRLGHRPDHRDRHGRPARPGPRRRRDHAVGRRAPSGGAVPGAAGQAGHPAARRAHQPPRRRDRRLAAAAPAGLRRDGRRRDPRPLLPRRGRRVDPRARPGRLLPLRGQLLRLARAEAHAAPAGGEGGVGSATPAGRGVRVGQADPAGPSQEGQGPRVRLRAAAHQGPSQAGHQARHHDPRWPAAR